jgi:predicted amidohydrolase YtcJ
MKPRRLREAHAHIAAHGREMSQLNLSGFTSRNECLERIAAEVSRLEAARESGWLLASGVRVEAWADSQGGAAWPSLRELDRACPKRPCMISSFDHHACVVNSAAMAAAGFGRASADPEGGRIVRDASGEPTGLLLEAAFGAMRRAVPTPTPDQLRRIVKAAVDDLAGHGFIEVHDLLSEPWLGPILADLDAAGELPVSVWLYPLLKDVGPVAAGRGAWETQRVRLAGAKIFADGTLNSRTAWMLEPYSDPLPGLEHGQPMQTPRQLADAMALTGDLGLGLAVHAIGDAAVRAVLDAWQGQPHREPVGSFPALRIEHAEIVDEADVPRFAELGVVCSVQPCHLLYDIEALSRGLPHRLDRVLPLRDLIRAGCRTGELMWFGSDTPIVRPHPEDSIQAAVKRKRAGMMTSIAPEQALTESEAWAAFCPSRE